MQIPVTRILWLHACHRPLPESYDHIAVTHCWNRRMIACCRQNTTMIAWLLPVAWTLEFSLAATHHWNRMAITRHWIYGTLEWLHGHCPQPGEHSKFVPSPMNNAQIQACCQQAVYEYTPATNGQCINTGSPRTYNARSQCTSLNSCFFISCHPLLRGIPIRLHFS